MGTGVEMEQSNGLSFSGMKRACMCYMPFLDSNLGQ